MSFTEICTLSFLVHLHCFLNLMLYFTVGRPTKFDRVVKREVCQISTRGTRVYSVLDGEASESSTNYLLAISEKVIFNIFITKFTQRKFLKTQSNIQLQFECVKLNVERLFSNGL